LNWLGHIHRMKEERREIHEAKAQGKNKRIKVRQEAAKRKIKTRIEILGKGI
jgi:hypothetical protein